MTAIERLSEANASGSAIASARPARSSGTIVRE